MRHHQQRCGDHSMFGGTSVATCTGLAQHDRTGPIPSDRHHVRRGGTSLRDGTRVATRVGLPSRMTQATVERAPSATSRRGEASPSAISFSTVRPRSLHDGTRVTTRTETPAATGTRSMIVYSYTDRCTGALAARVSIRAFASTISEPTCVQRIHRTAIGFSPRRDLAHVQPLRRRAPDR